MVNDSKAEALEAKGLYRRAASRWLEVFDKCDTEAGREWIRNRHNQCLGEASAPLRADRYLWRCYQSRRRHTAQNGTSQTGRRGLLVERCSELSIEEGRKTKEVTTIAMLIIIDRMFPIAINGNIKNEKCFGSGAWGVVTFRVYCACC